MEASETTQRGEAAVNDILEHAGVKGMKWGVRKAYEKVTGRGPKTPAEKRARAAAERGRAAAKAAAEKQKAAAKKEKATAKATAKAEKKAKRAERAERWRKEAERADFEDAVNSPQFKSTLNVNVNRKLNEKILPDLNAKYAADRAVGNLKDPYHPRAQQYHNELQTAYLREANRQLKVLHTPEGVKVTAVKREPGFWDEPTNALEFDIQLKDVKHADTVLWRVKAIIESDGLVKGFKIIEDTMTQGEIAVENILEHFGIKGMQWGVRRKATVRPEEVIVRDSRVPGSKRQVAKGGRGHPSVSEATRSREIGRIGQKSGTRALTNKQLEEYNRRLNLEQNFKRLQYQDLNPGQKFVKFMLGQSQKSATQAANEEATKRLKAKLATIAVAAA